MSSLLLAPGAALSVGHGRKEKDVSVKVGEWTEPEEADNCDTNVTTNEASALDILDADPRPTFVVDLIGSTSRQQLKICFRNAAFQNQKHLLAAIEREDNDTVDFRKWVLLSEPTSNSAASKRWHKSLQWLCYPVKKRYRVLQCISEREDAARDSVLVAGGPRNDVGVETSSQSFVPSPETDIASRVFGLSADAKHSLPGLQKLVEVISRVDWSSTSMGPLESWPEDLLQVIHLMLLEPQPHFVTLGPDKLMLYNVEYTHVAGQRHPAMMGMSLFEAWPEATDLNLRDYAKMDKTGAPVSNEDFALYINRNGFLEEAIFRWSSVALQGRTDAYYVSAEEQTRRKHEERQNSILLAVREAGGGQRRLEVLWLKIFQALEPYQKDFPLALLYVADQHAYGADQSIQPNDTNFSQIYRLVGVLGDEDQTKTLPRNVDIAQRYGFLPSTFRQARALGSSVKVGGIPENIANMSLCRGFGDPCGDVVVFPVPGKSAAESVGMMVLGLNTRRHYKEDYREWTVALRMTVAELVRTTMGAEEEDRLAAEADFRRADENKALTEQLANRTSESTIISEQLQRTLRMIEMVEVGVFDFNTDGKLIKANEAYYKLTGHPRAPHAAEFSFIDRVPEYDREKIMGRWSKLASGTPASFEMAFRKETSADPDGVQWVTAAVVPTFDEQGNITSVSGCIMDIAAQKQSQIDAIKRAEAVERAKSSELRFACFAELAPVGVFILNLDNKLQYVNKAWFNMMGLTEVPPLEFGNVDWAPLLIEEDLALVRENIRKMVETRLPSATQFRLKRFWEGGDSSVSHAWMLVSSYPELNEDGTVKGIMGTMTDISHLKWVERVQKLRLDEAVEARRQQENFIDVTCHEIRNPLGAVVHCADSVLSSLTEMREALSGVTATLDGAIRQHLREVFEGSFEAVNTIISCSIHQRRIIDDILTLSKLDSSLLQISPSPSQPITVLKDAQKMFEVDAQKVGVDFRTVKDPSFDKLGVDWVMLDPGRLMQILINLVTNAIKFTQQENQRKVVVRMGASREKPDEHEMDFVPTSTVRDSVHQGTEWGTGEFVWLTFSVKDTGCGLDDEQKARLFARFSQGSPRTHTKYGGSGLGLFISRELTELQGGEIGVSSQPGQGATFAFYIKARVTEGPKSKNTSGAHRASSIMAKGPDARYSILVVEDNIVNQAVLSKQLRKLGHEVHVASHGGEALDFLHTTKCWRSQSATANATALDVVLMDCEMPVMDGITCTRRIREAQTNGDIVAHLPIIAVSANARVEQVNQALECGMDDAISKPFRIADLVPKIERLVG